MIKRKRILIVDDDITDMRLLKLQLERTGAYEVREESHGEWVLATARAIKPDFVILDVCMPEVSGGEIAARIKADPGLRSIPVAFLTSVVSQAETGENGLVSGGYHYFSKPVNLRQLVLHIEASVPDAPAGDDAVPHCPPTSTSCTEKAGT